ncbi:MAG: PQQ-binding-like beta-propeller repeat protein, partial [Pirellulaceae bacterium]|nr:PQQ-binding-like beta-propeller repeat protein [Pirellulaceae bacterium]
HAPQPAWPRDDRMSFDRAQHVVISDGVVCFGSTVDGKVTALDAKTGATKWTFFTGGPVRFAPTVWKDRLFVGSDDGFLYSLEVATGKLIGRWRGGPREDRVLGNAQMVSKWPVRGGPVLRDGLIYWGAGIWQSEGVYLYAMKPDTGEVVWKNDRSGGLVMPQPHGGANAKSGVSAQGYLLANDDRLFVTTGRAVPASFRRDTGKFEYYRLQENTRRGGTTAVLAGDLIYNGGYAYRTNDGSLLGDRISGAVAAHPGGVVHGAADQLRSLEVVMKDARDRKGNPIKVPAHVARWQMKVPSGTSLIIAADKVVFSNGKQVATVDLKTGKSVWSADVDDTAYGLAVSTGRLLGSTASGAIHCFAASGDKQAVHRAAKAKADANAKLGAAADEILQRSGVKRGYCVDLGCGDGRLALELVRRSDLFVVAIDADPANVARARRRLDEAGVYGSRATVHLGDPSQTFFPKYFANLVVSNQSISDGDKGPSAAEVLRLQRPYGGVACLGTADGSLAVKARGALEGAGDWTHLYSNPANTLCSTDSIKGPLTAVWFRDMDLDLPQRHGRGPSPLFSQGRLFAEGVNELICVDAYNGLPLWRFEQQGVLDAYNADHLAGTAVTGSNICIAGDSLFLRNGGKCFRLDTKTGKVTKTYDAPPTDGKPSTWGYIACENGVLFGSTANEQHIVRHAYIRADGHMKRQFSESTSLFAFDVESGKLLWRYQAQQSIRHNAIAIGGGRVHLIDRPLAVDDLLARAPKRRGDPPKKPAAGHPQGQLVALDVRTGKPQWDGDEDVFGTTLAFSAEHEILLMFYQPTSFRLPSEVGGRIAAFNARTGYRLWEKKVSYRTRPLINQETIVAHPSALDLISGADKEIKVPKSYGCGQVSGSQHLLMFRSGTLGYYDFSRDAGTENYGGIRPGCWINALPVGGLVLVPDASSGCSCSYQNRSWVALEGSN